MTRKERDFLFRVVRDKISGLISEDGKDVLDEDADILQEIKQEALSAGITPFQMIMVQKIWDHNMIKEGVKKYPEYPRYRGEAIHDLLVKDIANSIRMLFLLNDASEADRNFPAIKQMAEK